MSERMTSTAEYIEQLASANQRLRDQLKRLTDIDLPCFRGRVAELEHLICFGDADALNHEAECIEVARQLTGQAIDAPNVYETPEPLQDFIQAVPPIESTPALPNTLEELPGLAGYAVKRREARQWISVDKRLPESYSGTTTKNVMVASSWGVGVGWYDYSQRDWLGYQGTLHGIYCWMPLPEPPRASELKSASEAKEQPNG
jgi:hypothetical protein